MKLQSENLFKGSDNKSMLCSCGSNNMHIETISTLYGNDDYEATGVCFSKGNFELLETSKFPLRLRKEGAVIITYSCEHCDIVTTHAIAGHKGQVFQDTFRAGVEEGACPTVFMVK